MYVVPTPFQLVEGLAHHYTLILPANADTDTELFEVGELIRTEAEELIVGYSFSLQANTLISETVPNPGAGTKHLFRVWRLQGSPSTQVTMRDSHTDSMEDDVIDDEAYE